MDKCRFFGRLTRQHVYYSSQAYLNHPLWQIYSVIPHACSSGNISKQLADVLRFISVIEMNARLLMITFSQSKPYPVTSWINQVDI